MRFSDTIYKIFQKKFIFSSFLLFSVSQHIFIYFDNFNTIDGHIAHRSDFHDDILGVIRQFSGKQETYKVTTEDGYILTLFRIPNENPKGVIFLDNSMCFDARIWVAQRNESGAILFWQEGYDVWLGNSRGSVYSNQHVQYASNSKEFKNYSFHEMGYYDSSAAIQFINMKTNGSKIIYIGYSLGASKALVYASSRSESTNLLKIIVAISPPITFSNGTSAIVQGFQYLGRPSVYLNEHFGIDLFPFYSLILKHDSWFVKLTRNIFKIQCFQNKIKFLLAYIFGWSDEIDLNLTNVSFELFGSYISPKTFLHLYQLFETNSFQMFDYGNEKNAIVYGTNRPPLYPVNKINIPVFIVYGENDTLSTPQISKMLFRSLSEEVKIHEIMKMEGFNHADFIVGKNRVKKFYKEIFKILRAKLNNNN